MKYLAFLLPLLIGAASSAAPLEARPARSTPRRFIEYLICHSPC